MNFKKMGLKFLFEKSETLCFSEELRPGFQTVGPKTEKFLFLKVSREKRGTVSRDVSRERSVLEG